MTLPERLAAYDSPEGAVEYLEEYDKIHRKLSDKRERKLLLSYFEQIGSFDSILDLPCGWGRYLPLFTNLGAKVIQGDYSRDMIRMSDERFPTLKPMGRVRSFGHQIPLADCSVRVTFSMRLNHHLVDPAVRREHVRDLLRVADKWCIFTYFDHNTVKNILRRARTSVGLCKKRPKNTLSRKEARNLVASCGFETVSDPMLFAIGSGHRVVLARRVGSL